MDKFEGKVRSALDKLEEEGKIESKPVEDEGLIYPMAFDSEEDLNEKKEKWMDIFQRCPDLSDRILSIYEKNGEEAMKILDKFICDKFDEYAKPFKEFFSEEKKDEE